MIQRPTVLEESLAAVVDAGLGEELSFAEELMWQAERDGSDALPFLECPRGLSFAVRLKGTLDETALSEALATVIERHAIFRSTFVAHNGRPRRRNLDSWQPAILPTDRCSCVSGASPSEQMRHVVETVIRPQLESPFDLAQGPLLRTALLTLADDDHVLGIAADHIIFDRWSKRLFELEWKRAYEARIARRPADLLPLAARYTDYVARQRGLVTSDRGKKLTEYWAPKLTGITDVALPFDRARAPVASTRSRTLWFSVKAEDLARLTALSRCYRSTLATTMLALFELLLYRTSGVEDISVGVPLSDRRRPEFEPLIGLFMNVVVVRTFITRQLAFGEFLDRVRRALVDACLHQDLPYGYLVGIVPRRPLYRVLFNFMPALPASGLEFAGVRAEMVPVPAEPRSSADLSLHVRADGNELHCSIVFKEDLFSENLAQSFISQFQSLTRGVLNNPRDAVHAYALQ